MPGHLVFQFSFIRRLFELFVEAECAQGEGLFYAIGESVFAAVVDSFAGADEKTKGHTEYGADNHRRNVVFAADFVSEIAGVLDAAIGAAASDSDWNTDDKTASDAGGADGKKNGVCSHGFRFISESLYIGGRSHGGQC